jgi:predicted MFS family arabinose efflux permease
MTNVDEQAEAVGEAVAADAALAAHGRDVGGWTAGSVYILAIITLISTLNYFDRSVLSLVLRLIKNEFKVSDATLGNISALVAVYAIVGVPMAWLAERWSRRNVIAIGLFFWSLMTVLTGFAGSILMLGLCRLLMATGESCGLAPSQSLVSDLFSRARRPLVLAIVSTASSIAQILYSPAAGWIAHTYGWRATFFAAGAPGLILAVIFVLTVREPQRRAEAQAAPVQAAPVSFMETIRFLMGSRTFLFCLAGTSIAGVYLYGVGAWGTMFLIRVRHFNEAQIGAFILPFRGLVAAGGIVLGGALASALEKRDPRWRCWIAGASLVMLAPCEFLYVFGGPMTVWIPAMLASSLFSIMHQGPIYAVYVGVAKARMRAIAVSIALLGATVVGQIGGPILIGNLNDMLNHQYGALAIRYSMLVVMACAVMGGLCFLAAARSLRQDTARAAEV